MPVRVDVPGHGVVEFPDGMTDDQIGAAIRQNMAQQPAPVRSQESLQASTLGRVIQGARDPIDEAAVLLPKGLQALTSLGGYAPNAVSKFFGSEAQRVQDLNKQNEAEYQAARQAAGQSGVDVARGIGNIVSPANAAIAAKLPMALRGMEAIKAGAGAGAIGGALTPSGDVSQDNYWANKLGEAAKGAALGAGITGALAGAARIVAPETNAKAAELLRQGITPTPGQILGGTAQKVEEQLQSVPILGHAIASAKGKTLEEFNKAALNRALSPIGESTDKIGREGVAEVKQKLSDAYDTLLPKIGFTPDAQFQQEFRNLQKMASGLGESEQKKFNSIISDVMSKASPNGSMDGATFKIAESKLSNEAKNFSGSTDAYQKELGGALNEALRIMRDTLPRVNPQYGDELSKINEAYANYARIRQAASSTATGAREGIFTPAQLAQAVRSMDKSAGKGASATGTALMQDLAEQGTNVLGSKVPDSGTAGRLMTAGAGGVLATNPALIAPVFAGVAPYVGVGRNLAATALTKRPAQAKELARLIRMGGVPLSIGAPMAIK